MIYTVNAVCLNVETGDVIAGPREELIDTATNELFAGCANAADVEDAYEAFWNRLNGFTNRLPDGKVKVLTVKGASD